MLHPRITAGACALCLVVPAAAAASPAQDPPAAKPGPVTYGDTRYDLQNQQDLNAPAGQARVDRVGSLTPAQLAAAYGTTKPAAPAQAATGARLDHRGLKHVTVVATPAKAAAISDGDDTNGWRIAAVAEAGLLAAFAIGGAAVVTTRQRRAPRMG
jgi:hypothetical protein